MSGSSSSLPKVVLSNPQYDGDFMKKPDFDQTLEILSLQCPRHSEFFNGTAVAPTLESVSELGASYIADSSFVGGASSSTQGADASDDILSDSLNMRVPRTPTARTSTSDVSVVQLETLKMNTKNMFDARKEKWDIKLQEASDFLRSFKKKNKRSQICFKRFETIFF